MSKDKPAIATTVNIRNKRAGFEYEFLEKYTAGIALLGSEIKSIRQSRLSLQGAYCTVQDGGLVVKEMNISPYDQAKHYNHDPKRDRKLLLNRVEIRKLTSKSQEKGLTIIPVRLFINDRGLAKLEIALARGKKLHDKRDDIREKDQRREMERKTF